MAEAVACEVRKPMTYGAAQAMKVLAAHRMGMGPSWVDGAEKMLRGEAVTATMGAMVSGEAVRMHNLMRTSEARVAEANRHVAAVQSEYGF